MQHTPTLRAELEHVTPRSTVAAFAGWRSRAGAGRLRRRLRARRARARAAVIASSTSSRGRAVAVLARGSPARTAGPRSAGVGEERRAALLAELARADVGVTVAVGAERGLGVVEVQRAARAPGRPRSATLVRAPSPCRSARADVIAGGEQVAGVQAQPEALVAAGGLEQRGQLLERAPERAARAGRVLQVQRAALALGQRLARSSRPARAIACADVARLGRAGMQHDAGGADRAARRAASASARSATSRGSRGPRWRS